MPRIHDRRRDSIPEMIDGAISWERDGERVRTAAHASDLRPLPQGRLHVRSAEAVNM